MAQTRHQHTHLQSHAFPHIFASRPLKEGRIYLLTTLSGVCVKYRSLIATLYQCSLCILDSNTMDSTLGSEPRRRGLMASAVKRQHEAAMGQEGLGDCEGSETEEGNMMPATPKRRRRGPRARASNDPEDDDLSRKGMSQGTCSGRRRRRHSSSRGGREDCDREQCHHYHNYHIIIIIMHLSTLH